MKPIALICGHHLWNDSNAIKQSLSYLPEGSTVAFINKGILGKTIEKVVDELKLEPLSPTTNEINCFLNFDEAFSNRTLLALSFCNKILIDKVLRARLKYQRPVRCFAFHNNALMGFATKNMLIRCQKSRIRSFVYLKDTDSAFRCSSLMVCQHCSRDYISHPVVITDLNNPENTYLNWVCNGEVVHL